MQPSRNTGKSSDKPAVLEQGPLVGHASLICLPLCYLTAFPLCIWSPLAVPEIVTWDRPFNKLKPSSHQRNKTSTFLHRCLARLSMVLTYAYQRTGLFLPQEQPTLIAHTVWLGNLRCSPIHLQIILIQEVCGQKIYKVFYYVINLSSKLDINKIQISFCQTGHAVKRVDALACCSPTDPSGLAESLNITNECPACAIKLSTFC